MFTTRTKPQAQPTRKEARKARMEAMKAAICAVASENSQKLEGTMTAWVYLVVPTGNWRNAYYVTRNGRFHLKSLDTDPKARLKPIEGFRGGKTVWACVDSPFKLEDS